MAKSKTRLKKPEYVWKPSTTSSTPVPVTPQGTYNVQASTYKPRPKLQQVPNYDIDLKPSVTVYNTAQAIDVARNKKRYPNESLQTNTLRNQASKVQSQATSSMMAGLDPTGISSITDMLAYGVQLPQDASGAIPIKTAKKAG